MTDHQGHEHSTPKTGPLIRLWGIKTDQLPPVPGAEGTGSNVDGLTQLLASLLREAVPFIDSVAPKGDRHTSAGVSDPTQKLKTGNWKPKGTKSYHPTSTAKVELFERVVGPKELEEAAAAAAVGKGKKLATGAGETWICRRSVHEDRKEKGTASWDEFRDCLKERHAETEEMFTPSVVRMEKGVVWDCGGVVCLFFLLLFIYSPFYHNPHLYLNSLSSVIKYPLPYNPNQTKLRNPSTSPPKTSPPHPQPPTATSPSAPSHLGTASASPSRTASSQSSR